MTTTSIKSVAVVGCGLMGSGVADICSRAGLNVVVIERDKEALAVGLSRIKLAHDRAIKKGTMSEIESVTLLAGISGATEFAALHDCDLIIEAVSENLEIKSETFKQIDQYAKSSAILASNTSSIPIATIGSFTSRPESVVGLHFFNPVQVMSLVEVVASTSTSDDVVQTCISFARDVLNKKPIVCVDRSGFVVNALLIPYLCSAIRMLENKVATAADIDTGMVEGCAHPIGPLALCDLIGLDTVAAIANTLADELQDEYLRPPALLNTMITAGDLGRKTGQGFFSY